MQLRPALVLALIPALAAAGLAPAVAAAEACVSCTGPDAIYRCTVEKSEKLEEFGIEDKVLRPVCARVLAKSVPHEACAAVGKPGDVCDGELRTLGLSDVQKAIAGPPATDTVVPSLAERAGGAAKSTGSAVGNAAKKTWNCITSLFDDCE